MSRHTIRLLAFGGIGDAVLSTPAIAALRAASPEAHLVVYCVREHQQAVFLHNPHLDDLVLLRPETLLGSWRLKFYRRQLRSLNYARMAVSLNYEVPVQYIIGDMLGVTVADPATRIYLTAAEQHDARRRLAFAPCPVVVQNTSRASANQTWPLDRWAALIQRWRDIQFIQIGRQDEKAIPGAIDWRGTTTPREAFAIIGAAAAFVGVVSGPGHVAAAIGTPSVVLFGPSTPLLWGHPSAINLYRNLPCAPCIDVLGPSRCPYGTPCMTGITVDDVGAALEQQLQHRSSRESPAKLRVAAGVGTVMMRSSTNET